MLSDKNTWISALISRVEFPLLRVSRTESASAAFFHLSFLHSYYNCCNCDDVRYLSHEHERLCINLWTIGHARIIIFLCECVSFFIFHSTCFSALFTFIPSPLNYITTGPRYTHPILFRDHTCMHHEYNLWWERGDTRMTQFTCRIGLTDWLINWCISFHSFTLIISSTSQLNYFDVLKCVYH